MGEMFFHKVVGRVCVCFRWCMCMDAAPHSSSAFCVLLSYDIPLIKTSCSLFGSWDRVYRLDRRAVRGFFFKGIIGYTCQEGDFSPGLLVRAACCHHASVGDSSRLIGEKRKGKRLQFFFLQWWLLSAYTLLLIYSNCGWDSLLTAKKQSFSEDLIGFF